jgi:hypothetical protein
LIGGPDGTLEQLGEALAGLHTAPVPKSGD